MAHEVDLLTASYKRKVQMQPDNQVQTGDFYSLRNR